MADFAHSLSSPRSIQRLTESADHELEQRLNDATFSLGPDNRFNLQLRSAPQDLLISIIPEISGNHFGILIQARPLIARMDAYDLSTFCVQVLKISAAPQEPVESIMRKDFNFELCCGPLDRNTQYLIQVLRPPKVRRLPLSPLSMPSFDREASDVIGSIGMPDPGRRVARSATELVGAMAHCANTIVRKAS